MEEGLYKVEFFTRLGFGSGVVMISNGTIGGGDSMMSYHGVYTVIDEVLSATVNVAQHSVVPGMSSVLGVTNATLGLVGSVNGNPIQLTLRDPSMRELDFRAQLTILATLVQFQAYQTGDQSI